LRAAKAALITGQYTTRRYAQLLLVEDRGNGNPQEFSASANEPRANAREAADLILAKCRQLAWLDSAIDQLGQLRDQTSL
jgi:hypothetical protein